MLTDSTRKKLQKLNPAAILFDNRFDAALMGVCYISRTGPVALYSRQKVYAILDAQGLNCEEKREYYQWHFQDLNGGEHTPVILDDLTE